MAFSVLGCGVVLLVVVGLVPLAIVYSSLRKTDPEHALRRSAGVGLLILGGLGMAGASAAFVAALFSRDTTMFETYFEPRGRGYEGYYDGLPGPGVLSAWVLLAGAAIGCGWFLFKRQFSLRSLLIGLILVASVASLPHLAIQPRDAKTVISSSIDRVLTPEEVASLELAFGKGRLCAAVSEPLKKALPCRLTDALKSVELQFQSKGGLESEGKVGVRLTLRFSRELERDQIESIFNELTEYVQKAMPPVNDP